MGWEGRARGWLVAVTLAAAGCGSVQRAALSESTLAREPTVPLVTEGAAKLVYRAPGSRLHVHASDLLNGDHSIVFDKFRGALELGRDGRGRFTLDVDMRTLRADRGFITDFARDLLDVYAHPRARIVARIEPDASGPGAVVLSGSMELHGVRRGIRFQGKLERNGDLAVFHAEFDTSRTAFAIRAREYDWIIRDDLRITFDFRGGTEHATVEEGVASTPEPPLPP